MHLQESGEMYLETIYVLSKKGVVRSLDVAEYMGFSKPSVSRAVGLLKQGGYLLMDKDGYLTLTDAGRAQDIRAAPRALESADPPRCQRRSRGRGRMQARARHKRRDIRGDKRARCQKHRQSEIIFVGKVHVFLLLQFCFKNIR